LLRNSVGSSGAHYIRFFFATTLSAVADPVRRVARVPSCVNAGSNLSGRQIKSTSTAVVPGDGFKWLPFYSSPYPVTIGGLRISEARRHVRLGCFSWHRNTK